MSANDMKYFSQSMGSSGLCVLNHRLAHKLRSDLWVGPVGPVTIFDDDRFAQRVSGLVRHIVRVQFKDHPEPVLVAAASLRDIEQRLEYLTGWPVVSACETGA